MRRLKGPRVAFRDRQWAFANRRLGAWVQGKGASRAQAAALAASPRRQQTRQGQLWQWTHRGKNERGPAPNPEPVPREGSLGHVLTRARAARRKRRCLSFKFVLALVAVLLCRDQLAVTATLQRRLNSGPTHLAEQGRGCTLAAKNLKEWDPHIGQRIGEASNPGPDPDREMQLASALLEVLQSFKEQNQQSGVCTGSHVQPKNPVSRESATADKTKGPQSVSLASRLLSVLQDALKQGWSDSKVADRVGQKVQA